MNNNKGVKMFKYKTIDTSTVKGIEQAEMYQRKGWKIISNGIYTIQFEKEIVNR